jgi:hypothetical protein
VRVARYGTVDSLDFCTRSDHVGADHVVAAVGENQKRRVGFERAMLRWR